MGDKVKVTVKAGRSIALGGKFLTGEAEVPAGKVEALVRKGLVEAPKSAEPAPAAVPEEESPNSDDTSDVEAADTKKAAKKGKK